MPELPEIETVKLQLEKVLAGAKIEGVEVRMKKTVQGDEKQAIGKKILGVRRRAKALIMDLEDGISMAFHFKMSGQLILDRDEKGETFADRIVGGHPTADFVGKLPSGHTRVIFDLDNGKLFFNDQRMFGWVKIGKREEIEKEKFFANLGPEPFDMTAREFKRQLGSSRRAIKLSIMDQTVISGVGNIYANDALWEANILPDRPTNSLTDAEAEKLFEAIKTVLNEGIKYGGATAADAKYINLHGLGGHYQEHFRTYDREGKNCLRKDGGIIERETLGGRGTFYCPRCQK
jgi:formamidopyrimidine-DNA glycosylase